MRAGRLWVRSLAAGGVVASTFAAISPSAAVCDDRTDPPIGWRGAALGATAASAAAWLIYQASSSGQQKVDTDSWQKKWEASQINFHLTSLHPALEAFGQRLLVGDGAPTRMLFPLCGKAVDMPHFARLGHSVVGCDCVRLAMESLVQETSGASISRESFIGPHQVVEIALAVEKPARMTFIVGDFFQLTPRTVGGTFEAVWDRGSLVAIAPELRKRYVETLQPMLVPGGRILLVTVEHDGFANGKFGPPFSVTSADLDRLFPAPLYSIEMLRREDRLPVEPAWRQRGCTVFYEATYLVTKRG